jgi:hypothetical protein
MFDQLQYAASDVRYNSFYLPLTSRVFVHDRCFLDVFSLVYGSPGFGRRHAGDRNRRRVRGRLIKAIFGEGSRREVKKEERYLKKDDDDRIFEVR